MVAPASEPLPRGFSPTLTMTTLTTSQLSWCGAQTASPYARIGYSLSSRLRLRSSPPFFRSSFFLVAPITLLQNIRHSHVRLLTCSLFWVALRFPFSLFALAPPGSTVSSLLIYPVPALARYSIILRCSSTNSAASVNVYVALRGSVRALRSRPFHLRRFRCTFHCFSCESHDVFTSPSFPPILAAGSVV